MEVVLATRDAHEAHALAKDGALTGLSIGWEPKRTTREGDTRVIVEAELHEGSLVAVPMNPKTHVTAIKSITRAQDIRELLQAAGVPRDRANDAGGLAWKAVNETDANGLNPETVTILKASAARIAAIGRKR